MTQIGLLKRMYVSWHVPKTVVFVGRQLFLKQVLLSSNPLFGAFLEIFPPSNKLEV